MHKKKFSDEQQELVALLPQGLPKMTDGAKLVLANIILWYGTDKAKETGIMYRTNQDMMTDCEIGSENTIIKATKQLEMLGLIDSKRGKRGEASEYRLSDEMLDKINFKPQSAGESAVINRQSAGESAVINQLVEQNKALTLIVSELQSEVIMLQSEVKRLIEQSKCSNNTSKCSTDTESDKEKEKKDLVTKGTSTCEKDEVISTEGTGASAYGVSSSLIEEELASAFEPISTDTSTEDTRNDSTVVISTSSNEDLTTADRLTYLQPLEESTPPSSAAPPLTEDFVNHVKAEIRNGVYQWSLNLTEVPDFIVADDYNPIVVEAIKTQPDYNDYLGNINLSELNEFARELMENRLKNKDIPKIVRQNQYKIRHEQHRNELTGGCVRMGSNSMIATGSAQMACA